MTKVDQDTTIYIGDTINLVITVRDDAEVAIDITGATVAWNLYDERIGSSLIAKTTSSGITLTTPLSGIFTIALSAADTAALSEGVFYHEAEVTDASSNVSTVTTGHITVLVSRAP